MKVMELVEFVGNSKNKMLKGVQLEELIAKKIEVKKYLGIKEKKALVEAIVDECILFEDGVFKFDDIDKYLCFTMRVIEAYTNIELSVDFEDDYDLLCQSGLLEMIINTFKKEYDDVNILLQMKCDYVLSENNMSAHINKFLANLSARLDDLSGALVSKIDDFDLDVSNLNLGDIKKLMEFINK